MNQTKRFLLIGGASAMLLGAHFAASAQESGGNTIIGPPQLKDFSLQPRERIVTQPEPQPAAPVTVAPPPPRVAATPENRTTQSRPSPSQGARAPASQAPQPRTAPLADAPATQDAAPIDRPPAAAPAPVPIPAPTAVETPAAPASDDRGGTSYWLYLLGAAALALFGLFMFRRRRRAAEESPAIEPAVLVETPVRAPRPDPIPRPWLELSLRAERAAFTAEEAEIQFELEISNKGGSPARNLRIDVKMFNAGAEQDKEIGAFFRTAGRETTKLNLPRIEAGVSGLINATVGMKREEIRAMRLDERLLFIPVVAVNALYDWGDGRTGQTSRSYLIGREQPEPSEKMGAFRVDQGPRIWRTVGQRQHRLAKRV